MARCRAAAHEVFDAHTAHRVASASRAHERLMNRYDVNYCHLDLAVERNVTTLFPGSNVRTWALNRPVGALDTLAFELLPSLTIDSVQVNGQRVPNARVQRLTSGDVRVRLLTPIASGARFNYQVWYRGTPASTGGAAIGDGITSMNSTRWGNRVLWTLSQPFSAYEWWPCKQILADKIDSVRVWVTTDATNKAGSNGLLERVTPRPGGKERYEWVSRYPIAYYLVSIAVAEYVDYTIYARPAALNGDSIPVVNYIYNNPQTLPFWQADIDQTVPMIENFSEKLGLYPFWREKYGHSMAPLGGGMEHQTMTTQGTFDYTLTAHELMHQWFGDNVTCRSWRDIWLNEGFASYGEYITLQALQPADAPAWLADTRQASLTQFTGSVAVDDTLSNNRIFDYALTYQKGAMVVHMLRHVFDNDSLFFAALRTYQQQYRDSVATTADFQRSVEASLGQPLGWFFSQWVDGQGFARVDAGWNQVGARLVVESNQTATSPSITPFFRMPLEVRVSFAAGGPAPMMVRVEQTQASQRWTLPVPAGATVSRIDLDTRFWNLVQVTRVRRNNQLQPLGRTAEAATATFTLHPNPCTDRLHVPADAVVRTATVFDLTGRQLLTQTLAAGSDEFATHTLAPGAYVLRLTTADGQTRQARFVKAQ
jgi:aminopeptidase N